MVSSGRSPAWTKKKSDTPETVAVAAGGANEGASGAKDDYDAKLDAELKDLDR